MDRNELISSILSFEDNIGMWRIALSQITDAEFIMGYGFVESTKVWKVYQNNERGMKAEPMKMRCLDTMRYIKIKLMYNSTNL